MEYWLSKKENKMESVTIAPAKKSDNKPNDRVEEIIKVIKEQIALHEEKQPSFLEEIIALLGYEDYLGFYDDVASEHDLRAKVSNLEKEISKQVNQLFKLNAEQNKAQSVYKKAKDALTKIFNLLDIKEWVTSQKTKAKFNQQNRSYYSGAKIVAMYPEYLTKILEMTELTNEQATSLGLDANSLEKSKVEYKTQPSLGASKLG